MMFKKFTLYDETESVASDSTKPMSDYLTTYREWTTLKAWIKRLRNEVTPEKYQEMKKKERELLAKLNSML